MIILIFTIIIVAVGFGLLLKYYFDKISVSINNDISSKLGDVIYLLKSLNDNILEINKKTKSIDIIKPKDVIDNNKLFNDFKHYKLSDIVGEDNMNKNNERIIKYEKMNLDNPELNFTIYKYYFDALDKECILFERGIIDNDDINNDDVLIDRIKYVNNNIKMLDYNINYNTTSNLNKQHFIREKEILENHLIKITKNK